MALITDLDDRTLVEQHRAGDPDAFRRIVSRHHRSLYSNALRRLGDPTAAEDAVQDAFLRAFRNIERFDGDYHLDAWLHRIVTNTCHDIGRRRGRDTKLFDRACTEVEVDVPPADEALDATPREQITEALDSLPESYREVLVLRFVDELSYADVAEQAGISEENARARVSRGRNMLKRMLTSTSALLVWAIAPLRRQTPPLTGAEAEAASSAATHAHGLATIASVAPAPTSAFTQVSGIIAQAGPAIATAAPAVTTTAPTLKAAVAVGLAASVAIPAGVAVDRARQEPTTPAAGQVEDFSSEAVDAPVEVRGASTGSATVPSTSVAPVGALAAGDQTVVGAVGPSTSTSAPSTSVAPTSGAIAPETAPEETTSSGSTPPATSGGGQAPATPPPGSAPPAEEPPPPAPAPTQGPPGQLSASVSVTEAGGRLDLAGPVNLQIGDRVLVGQLSGKLDIAAAGPKAEGEREVHRSDLKIVLDDGTVLDLTVQGRSTVTTQGSQETHDLTLQFMLVGGAALDLAEDGTTEGTFVLRKGSGELGLALPGAIEES